MYTNKSIRIVKRLENYLALIQKANNYLRNAESDLIVYDNSGPFDLPRLMHNRWQITDRVKRYNTLSKWLVCRYQSVLADLNIETVKQFSHEVV